MYYKKFLTETKKYHTNYLGALAPASGSPPASLRVKPRSWPTRRRSCLPDKAVFCFALAGLY